MKLKKVRAISLVIIMTLGLLVGCSSSNNSTGNSSSSSDGTTQGGSNTSSSEDKEGVTLRFSWWGGDERHAATLAVIEAYERENPHVKIEAEYSSFDGYMEKKTTEFASGTAPDIFQIETGSGPEYYKQGVLYNLSTTSLDFSKFDSYFLEENGQFGSGSQYAIPTGQAGTALIVNKTLADAVGIDLSQQYYWEDLIEMGKKVREYDSDSYLISANTSYATAFIVRAWCRQANNSAIIDSDFNLNMTREQFEECFEFIKRLYDEEVCAPASYKAAFGDQDQEDPNWIAGKYVAALAYTSSANVLSAVNNDIEFMAGSLPLMLNGVNDGWVNDCPQFMGVYANTKYPEEASKFLDFFFNSEEAAAILGTVRSVPPTAMAQEICEKAGTLNPLTKESVEVSIRYNGRSDSGPATSAEVKAILENAYDNVAYGTMSPEEAADEVMELLTDYIDRQS